jgi:hypothetical protein
MGRIVYFRGYATGSPRKRFSGFPLFVSGALCLIVICLKAAVRLAASKLAA